MTTMSSLTPEAIIHDAGEDWLLDNYSDGRGAALSHLNDLIVRTAEEYDKRYASDTRAPRPSWDALADLLKTNAHRTKAFLQATATASGPVMLVMVWRILFGDEILSVELKYHRRSFFSMNVQLKPPHDTNAQQFLSEDIKDAALLRHLLILKADGKPLFDGFFPHN